MKIKAIHTVVIHHIYTEDNWYKRYGPDDWTEEICYDIISEEQSIEPELSKELEALFQVEMALERMMVEEELKRIEDDL
jgi:hypothetical protein